MKINDAKSFGMAIRRRRKELGYTQAYIAEVTGLSSSYISDLENGKQTTELGKALFLTNVLGMDMIIESRDKR